MARLDSHLQMLESLRRRLGFLVDAFRVRQFASRALMVVPIRRRSDAMSVRLRCWSDILAYEEIFGGGIYDSVFDAGPVATYCDLGCQSGMAILRLANRVGPPQRSLLIDGNPLAVQRCRQNIREAGIVNAAVVHGAVGCAAFGSPSSVEFLLLPNELECSVAAEGLTPVAGRTVTVPVIDLETAWLEHCGDVSCDLLKMDIEGAEVHVLREETRFLKRVQRCVLEWHDPPASLAEIIPTLTAQGFVAVESIWQSDSSGVLTCSRSLHERDARPRAVTHREPASPRDTTS
jgi:FkbM family methyltransferase